LTHNAICVTINKTEKLTTGKTATLNLKVNADMMSVAEVHQKLEKGFAEYRQNEIKLAHDKFLRFWRIKEL